MDEAQRIQLDLGLKYGIGQLMLLLTSNCAFKILKIPFPSFRQRLNQECQPAGYKVMRPFERHLPPFSFENEDIRTAKILVNYPRKQTEAVLCPQLAK